MAEDSVSLEGPKAGKLSLTSWRSMSLKWKIATAFSLMILLLGITVLAIVYSLTGTALRKQVDARATAIASNLSDAAAPLVARKNTLELDSLIGKYGRLDGVAYAFIEDPKADVLASSTQPFPNELKEVNGGDSRTAGSRTVTLRGRTVYETKTPVLDGTLGAARVGLWADSVQQDVRNTLLPIVGLIGVCLLVGILLALLIANATLRPITELAAVADDISRGRLDTPVTIQSNDEVGELARSLERMRASLKAAMARLSRN